jgi:imidazole glycerol-phosphate synthase subunit HisH
MIAVLDFNLGNTGSVVNMLKRLGCHVKIAKDTDSLVGATGLILPGVGAFDRGMDKIDNSGLKQQLNDLVLVEKLPVLGICLGMQLMTKGSEEGETKGLGWIDAHTVKFTPEGKLKYPHMGWNLVEPHKNNELFMKLDAESKFYFVHNYHVECNDKDDVMTSTDYGYKFTSSFQHENIWGCQFHPEKSHKFGMQLLETWANQC